MFLLDHFNLKLLLQVDTGLLKNPRIKELWKGNVGEEEFKLSMRRVKLFHFIFFFGGGVLKYSFKETQRSNPKLSTQYIHHFSAI